MWKSQIRSYACAMIATTHLWCMRAIWTSMSVSRSCLSTAWNFCLGTTISISSLWHGLGLRRNNESVWNMRLKTRMSNYSVSCLTMSNWARNWPTQQQMKVERLWCISRRNPGTTWRSILSGLSCRQLISWTKAVTHHCMLLLWIEDLRPCVTY